MWQEFKLMLGTLFTHFIVLALIVTMEGCIDLLVRLPFWHLSESRVQYVEEWLWLFFVIQLLMFLVIALVEFALIGLDGIRIIAAKRFPKFSKWVAASMPWSGKENVTGD